MDNNNESNNNENLKEEPKTTQAKEEQKKKSIVPIIILLLISLVLIGYGVFYLLNNNNNSNNNNNKQESEKKEDNKEEDKLVPVNLNEEEIKKLVNIVPVSEPYSSENEYSAFDNKKVETKDMDVNWLVYKAMIFVTEKGTCTEEQFQLNGLCDFTLKKEDVEKSVKNLYDASITLPNKVDSNFLFHCTLDNDVYACSNTGGGYVLNNVMIYFDVVGNRTFVKYEKAEKDSKYLYLTVKFAKYEFVYDNQNLYLQPGEITFRIRKYGTGNEVIDETILNGEDYYEENASKSFDEKIYEKFGDKLTTYKLTYKIDGDSYKLVSTEPVE